MQRKVIHADTYQGRSRGLPEGYSCSIPRADVRYLYRALRTDMNRAGAVLRCARILEHAAREMEAGRLMLMQIADDNPDLSWLDQTDAEMGRGFQAEAKRTRERADQDGCWGIASYVRLSEREEWTLADSLWGFIGDDWADDCYDVLQAGIEKLEELEDSACPTCGHSMAHAKVVQP